jgi:hypothetical protein
MSAGSAIISSRYPLVRASEFEETAFFEAIERAGVRALLPGGHPPPGGPARGGEAMRVPRIEVDASALARARELADRRVSAEEFRRASSEPLSTAERDEVLSLVRWFCRRYPTAADRLAYVRRTYERWTRTQSSLAPTRSGTSDEG